MSHPSRQSAIEQLIADEYWPEARGCIQAALKDAPKSHWLWSRLSLTYYEEYRYEKALRLAEKAREFHPECPLACWEQAGALSALKRYDEAIAIYKDIISEGISNNNFNGCWEDADWALHLMSDSVFRISDCYLSLNERDKADIYLKVYRNLHFTAGFGTYSLDEVPDGECLRGKQAKKFALNLLKRLDMQNPS